MIFEMELRGYAQHTKDHYLGHLRLLEKHINKSAPQITPDELRQYLHDRIKSGIGYSSITISCSAFKLFFNKVLDYAGKPLLLNIKQKDAKVCRSCGSTEVITILVPYSLATASSA